MSQVTIEQQLRQLKRGEPCETLDFFVGDEKIKSHQILRIVPQRRIVMLAERNGEPVIVKLFFDRWRAKKHYEREIKANKALALAKILTPNILNHGSVKKSKNVFAIVFEKIEEQEQENLQEKKTKMLAKCHQANIFLEDPHPSNFLVSNNHVYIIDLSAIKEQKSSWRQRLKNLSYYSSQTSVPSGDVLENIMKTYADLSEVAFSGSDKKMIKKYYWQFCRKEESQLLKKIFRSSTRHEQYKKNNMNVIIDRSEINNISTRLGDIDRWVNEGEMLKNGNTCTVSKIKINGRVFVIKRYNIKNFLHRMKRIFQMSRAAKCWANAHRLLFYGIKTPRPIAMIEKKWLFFKSESYYICDYLDSVSADYLLKHSNPSKEVAIFWLRKIIQLMLKLKQLCIKHEDMKTTNFLFKDDNIYLIDLDGMKKSPCFWYKLTRSFQKGMRRMIRNWDNRPELDKRFRKLMEDDFGLHLSV